MNYLKMMLALIISAVSQLFGGWDKALVTLVIFMGIDYVTGLIVAGVFKASPKTGTGALESRAGFKGLLRKGMTLLIVLIATRIDLIMETHFVRDAAVIAYIVNESISIVENVGLMGLPVPQAIIKAIDILKKRADEKNEVKSEKDLESKTR